MSPSVHKSSVGRSVVTSTNPVINLIKVGTLGVMAAGVVLLNSLGVPTGEDVKRDTINVLGGIETSPDCASSGCLQSVVGVTESMDLYNLSGSFVIGTPTNPTCELSHTGALQGSSCVITAGVQILGTVAGTLTQTAADARYVNISGDTMTGALNVRAALSGSSLTIDNLHLCTNLQTDSNGALSCNTATYLTVEKPSVNTGGVLVIGDARYVPTAGGTMTGALNVIVTGGNAATRGINSHNTISGAILFGYRGRFGVSLASSGSLVWEGAGSGNKLHIEKEITASGALTVVGEPRIQRIISIPLCDAVTACATGSGVIVRIPKMMNNYAFSGATLDAGVAGTTGTMSVQVINITDGTNLFSTKISLDSAEVSSDTAATPYVRNATLGQRTVTDGDRIMPRVDAVHTTPAKGVTINLHFIPL